MRQRAISMRAIRKKSKISDVNKERLTQGEDGPPTKMNIDFTWTWLKRLTLGTCDIFNQRGCSTVDGRIVSGSLC